MTLWGYLKNLQESKRAIAALMLFMLYCWPVEQRPVRVTMMH